MQEEQITTVIEEFEADREQWLADNWEEPEIESAELGAEIREADVPAEAMAAIGLPAEATRVAYRIVDLRGKIPGSPGANQGAQRKTGGTIVHYNGPATNVPGGGSPVTLYHNDARFHMQTNWGGGARANGIQYHEGIWGDTVYILRNPDAILWHCGSWPQNANSKAVNIPIGQGQRATQATLRTMAARIKDINASQNLGVRATKGHQEVSATLCPGSLMSDFVRPFRAGQLDPGEAEGEGKPKPEPTGNPRSLAGEALATKEQAGRFLRENGAHERTFGWVELCWKWGGATGIRPDVLLAQECLETDFGRFTGKVPPEYHNVAGIKIKSPSPNDVREDHERFPGWSEGIRAHANHLCAYAGLKPVRGDAGQKVHDRYSVVASLPWAGTIKTTDGLSGRYAPRQDYASFLHGRFLNPLRGA